VDALALKIAVAHHLGAAKHVRVELKGALHILYRQPEMLDALQSRAECCSAARLRLRRRGGRSPGDGKTRHHRGAAAEQQIAPLDTHVRHFAVVSHRLTPSQEPGHAAAQTQGTCQAVQKTQW
jgi:hypothetical protein